MTSSTIQIAPRAIPVRDAVSFAEPAHIPALSPTIAHALARAAQPDYFDWLDHVRPAAGCTRPIRLTGEIHTVRRTGSDTATILDTWHTDELPDATIYKACGNRRASVCPACARTYQYDAYQILRAMLAGGKGVPDTVTKHPAIFATATGPSFGLVHTRVVRRHTCTNRRRCDCRPQPCRARTGPAAPGLCQHGQPSVCFARHDRDDPVLGQPFCLDCYDHDHQVVWNHFVSGELWRRTKQAAERYLHQLARQRGIPDVLVLTPAGTWKRKPPVALAHGKSAEMQRRGVVHFHALLRLDGVDPLDATATIPPPAGFTSLDLEDAMRHAVAQVAYTTPAHPDRPDGWPVVWGEQFDVQHITLSGDIPITDDLVSAYLAAGYLAKYATKDTEATGYSSTRITPDTVNQRADADGDHIARLIDACWRLGRPATPPVPLSQRPTRPVRATRLGPAWTCPDCATTTQLRICPQCAPTAEPDPAESHTASRGAYSGLRRWAHRLGFGGHFLTKSRRGVPTFGLLRSARVIHRRDPIPQAEPDPAPAIRTADHTSEETPLIVGVLTFAGVGWHNTGDALLANTSAALARARRQAAHEELAHEIGTARITTGTTPFAA